MSKILIAYATSEGQAGRIAEHLATVIRGLGHTVTAVEVTRAASPDPRQFDAVIVGGSVHIARHQRPIRDFARRNRAVLEHMPAAFFSVSMAIHDDPRDTRGEVGGYIERFVRDTGWRPSRVGLFAGALLYTQYGWITRWIMKRIARRKGNRDTDTTKDHVYTDWDAVRRFAEAFVQTLAADRKGPVYEAAE